MLSYQHIYHAGNHVDCHKHLILSVLLDHLKQKDVPFCYLETHAGRGLYDLLSPEAQKIKEHDTGIMKIWPKKDWPEAAKSYRKMLSDLNRDGIMRYYPGSPYLAHALRRTDDRLELFELHPQEFQALTDTMGKFDNTTVERDDGWTILGSYLPPEENRGLVFIDPSYEVKDDYAYLPQRLMKAIKFWRNGIYAIWYPILRHNHHVQMKQDFIDSGIRKILCSEILFTKTQPAKGIWGTGMIVINPPWHSEDTIKSLTEWVTESIGYSSNTFWLVEE